MPIPIYVPLTTLWLCFLFIIGYLYSRMVLIFIFKVFLQTRLFFSITNSILFANQTICGFQLMSHQQVFPQILIAARHVHWTRALIPFTLTAAKLTEAPTPVTLPGRHRYFPSSIYFTWHVVIVYRLCAFIYSLAI